jgi:hypothetical protein
MRPPPHAPDSGHYEVASDGGAESWATIALLIQTAKLNEVEPFACLRASHPHIRPRAHGIAREKRTLPLLLGRGGRGGWRRAGRRRLGGGRRRFAVTRHQRRSPLRHRGSGNDIKIRLGHCTTSFCGGRSTADVRVTGCSGTHCFWQHQGRRPGVATALELESFVGSARRPSLSATPFTERRYVCATLTMIMTFAAVQHSSRAD